MMKSRLNVHIGEIAASWTMTTTRTYREKPLSLSLVIFGLVTKSKEIQCCKLKDSCAFVVF